MRLTAYEANKVLLRKTMNGANAPSPLKEAMTVTRIKKAIAS